ncbi:MAG: hypothetical protein GYB65_21825 [Chloroflexi bacterium]|nr:hypothetical protein [Chloroflexota bacterium]
MWRSAFLHMNRALYGAARPLIFRSSAQTAHERVLRLLRWADGRRAVQQVLGAAHGLAFDAQPVTVGGVTLSSPLILAAGFVKGDGFASESDALAAVQSGRNIIPGWRSVPRLVGAVEFGSYTRWPRLGNPGVVVWRDVPTRSTQNRVGLRNPGAAAAAEFLLTHADELPPEYGINIAVSPGVDDPAQQRAEVTQALAAFVERGVSPAWYALNLSCPNTEDDPHGHQTANQARDLCGAAVDALGDVPLWVKISPGLGAAQYQGLMAAFDAVGVRAVIATNTLGQAAPDGSGQMAGVGGGRLHTHALETARTLVEVKAAHGYNVDVIGCGGVQDAATLRAFTDLGVPAVQYWSTLIYRGPLAAALILHDMARTTYSTRNTARTT